MKKITIIHPFLDNIGGAEIVTLRVAKELNADIITTNINPDKIKKLGYETLLPKIKSIGKIPKTPILRQTAAFIIFSFYKNKQQNNYIFGDWAITATIRNTCVWYAHSPPRELYDLNTFVYKNICNSWQKPIFYIWSKIMSKSYAKIAKKTKKIFCNSNNTKKRIRKYLDLKAETLYPPIIFPKKQTTEFKKKYFLSVNRLLKSKRIELQLNAFKKLPSEKLIIIGSYEDTKHFKDYKKELEKKLTKNVTLLSNISNKQYISYLKKSKALIQTAIKEDFGLGPIEAASFGVPSIAPKEGGYKETITKKTGILIENINEKKLINAIKSFDQKKYEKKELIKHSKKYDVKKFCKQLIK